MVTQTNAFHTDSTNSTRLLEPVRESSGWIGVSGSITRDAEGWYLVSRFRTGDTGRGRFYRGYSNPTSDPTSTSDWTQEWEVTNGDVGMASFEYAEVRKFNDTWYLYFCYDTGGTNWEVSYVTASSFSGLGSQLADANTWTTIWGDNWKDPMVCEIEGEYYVILTDNTEPEDQVIAKSDSPTFDTTTTLYSTFISDYESATGRTTVPGSPCKLTYDADSGTLVAWANNSSGTDLYNLYATSSDGGDTWSYDSYEQIRSNHQSSSGDYRHHDYHSLGSGAWVMTGEYTGREMGEGTEGESALYIWDYR
jgi:hypothetical protein